MKTKKDAHLGIKVSENSLWRFATGHYLTESMGGDEFGRISEAYFDGIIADDFATYSTAQIAEMIGDMVVELRQLCGGAS